MFKAKLKQKQMKIKDADELVKHKLKKSSLLSDPAPVNFMNTLTSLNSSMSSIESTESHAMPIRVKEAVKLLKSGMKTQVSSFIKQHPSKYHIISDKFENKFP